MRHYNEVSPPRRYPWMVSLQSSNGFHTCGGVLITPTKAGALYTIANPDDP
jgi:hypothetical protein